MNTISSVIEPSPVYIHFHFTSETVVRLFTPNTALVYPKLEYQLLVIESKAMRVEDVLLSLIKTDVLLGVTVRDTYYAVHNLAVVEVPHNANDWGQRLGTRAYRVTADTSLQPSKGTV